MQNRILYMLGKNSNSIWASSDIKRLKTLKNSVHLILAHPICIQSDVYKISDLSKYEINFAMPAE